MCCVNLLNWQDPLQNLMKLELLNVRKKDNLHQYICSCIPEGFWLVSEPGLVGIAIPRRAKSLVGEWVIRTDLNSSLKIRNNRRDAGTPILYRLQIQPGKCRLHARKVQPRVYRVIPTQYLFTSWKEVSLLDGSFCRTIHSYTIMSVDALYRLLGCFILLFRRL